MKAKASKHFYVLLSINLLILLLTIAGMILATYFEASRYDLQTELYNNCQTVFQLGTGTLIGLLGGHATK